MCNSFHWVEYYFYIIYLCVFIYTGTYTYWNMSLFLRRENSPINWCLNLSKSTQAMTKKQMIEGYCQQPGNKELWERKKPWTVKSNDFFFQSEVEHFIWTKYKQKKKKKYIGEGVTLKEKKRKKKERKRRKEVDTKHRS